MNDYDAVKEDITEIKQDVKDVLKILNPLTIKVALNEQSVKRVWWWLGSISIAFVSGGIYALFRSI